MTDAARCERHRSTSSKHFIEALHQGDCVTAGKNSKRFADNVVFDWVCIGPESGCRICAVLEREDLSTDPASRRFPEHMDRKRNRSRNERSANCDVIAMQNGASDECERHHCESDQQRHGGDDCLKRRHWFVDQRSSTMQ